MEFPVIILQQAGPVLVNETLVEVGTGLRDIRLIDIEDILHDGGVPDIIAVLGLLRKAHVLTVGYHLPGRLAGDGGLGKKHGEGAGALRQVDERQLAAFAVGGGDGLAVRPALVVEVHQALTGHEYGDLEALLVTVHHQHEGVHAVIAALVEGLRPGHLVIVEPVVGPAGDEGGDLLPQKGGIALVGILHPALLQVRLLPTGSTVGTM